MTALHVPPVAAVLVAAGSGSRLGAPVPKALVSVAGVPLVERAASALLAGGVARVVVVAPESHLAEFRSLFAAQEEVRVVVGGAQRQDSVRLGLDTLDNTGLVLVHDAARPFVPAAVVQRVIDALHDGARAVVPVMPVVDSIRLVGADGNEIVDRSGLRAIQTPQGFDMALLRAAHAHVDAQRIAVTDDASACESLGEPVVLVAGDREAFKITEPFDLMVAEALAAHRATCGEGAPQA